MAGRRRYSGGKARSRVPRVISRRVIFITLAERFRETGFNASRATDSSRYDRQHTQVRLDAINSIAFAAQAD